MTAAVTESPSTDAQPQTVPPVRDAELLRRYVRRRDEAAFAELVERHSRLVVGVCRRVLRCEHDVEDAFQATFLVLARDAARIRKLPSLASWLHGVAYRTSLRAIDNSGRRRRLLRDLAMMDDTDTPDSDTPDSDAFALLEERHQRQALDEEMADLPDNYRAPLVLHYLEGKSNQQVADDLGTTVTAVEGRLKRGKKELRLRLARRGIGLSVAVAAMHAVQSTVTASTLTPLVARTIDAGLSYAGGEPPGPVYTPEAARLAGQEILAMSTTTAATLATALLIPFVLAIPGDVSIAGGYEPAAAISTEVAESGSADEPSPHIGTTEAAADTTEGASSRSDPVVDSIKMQPTDLGTVSNFQVHTLKNGSAIFIMSLADGKSFEVIADRMSYEVDENGKAVFRLTATKSYLGLESGEESGETVYTFTLNTPKPNDEKFDYEVDSHPVSEKQLAANAESQPQQDSQTTPSAQELTKPIAEDKPLSPSSDTVAYAEIPQNVARIEHELDKPTQVEFVDTPLSDAIDFIAQHHNITILMDTQAMTDVGIATDEPTNLILRDLTLRSILHHILRPLGLTTIIRDEVLTVTTSENADDHFETRVYNTRNLGNLQNDQIIKVLENGTVGPQWENRDKVGGTATAIDGGLVIKQTQSGHEQVASLLSQLRRKHLAEQQQGVTFDIPAMGMEPMMGRGFGRGRAIGGAYGGMGFGGGMGAGGGGGAPGMAGMTGMLPAATEQPLATPKTTFEPAEVDKNTPRLVIYDVGDLAESLIPKPEQADDDMAGGGGGGISGTAALKHGAINTISQIFQMGAMKSDIPFSSERLPDGTIAVMSTPAGHRIVEETLETLREHAKKPRTGRAFPGGGGGFF